MLNEWTNALGMIQLKLAKLKVHVVNTVSKGVCFTDQSIHKPSKLLGNHDCHQPRGSLVRSWILTGGQMALKIKEIVSVTRYLLLLYKKAHQIILLQITKQDCLNVWGKVVCQKCRSYNPSSHRTSCLLHSWLSPVQNWTSSTLMNTQQWAQWPSENFPTWKLVTDRQVCEDT